VTPEHALETCDDGVSSAARGPMAVAVALLVGGPVALAAVVMAALIAGGQVGVGPLRARAPMTLAEAAVSGDAATVLRRLREGHSPNGATLAARAFVEDGPREMLPLEAAALGGDDATVELLQRHGATLPPDAAYRIACATAALGRLRVATMVAGETFDPRACTPPGIR